MSKTIVKRATKRVWDPDRQCFIKPPPPTEPAQGHTPGPWMFGRGGDTILRVYRKPASGENVICQFGEGIDECWEEHKNAEANARLIAAAPDLLAGLLDAVERFAGAPDNDEDDEAAIARYRAAIAKAEGRAQ